MKIKREGGREGSLVELGEKRVRIADRQFNKEASWLLCRAEIAHLVSCQIS